jgi:hypothetical protein
MTILKNYFHRSESGEMEVKMKKKYLFPILSIGSLLCVVCFYKYTSTLIGTTNKNVKPNTVNEKSNTANVTSNTEKSNNANVTSNTVTKEKQLNASSNNTNPGNSSNNTTQPSSNNSNQNFYKKVKEYIINEQNNLSSAERLNWSKRFLDQVNLEDLYKKYTSSGGDADNTKDFAKYITLNAPPAKNWRKLFEKDYQDLYGKPIKITKIVNLGSDLYQIYINQNGSEVPFVVVSSRTGYFHG